VVVTLSPGAQLGILMDSLVEGCTYPYEVVLADNGSADGSPEREAARPGVSLVRTGGNIGYGGAANLGARGAMTEFLLICNPDLVFEAGSIDHLIDAARAHPEVGACGPAILAEDGALYPSARAQPTLAAGIGHGVLGPIWPGNPWTRAYLAERKPVERVAGWLSGACLLVRTKAWEEVGGFDPRYFMYFEDVDLGDRLARAGWSSRYVPEAHVTHVGGTTTARSPIAMQRAHHESAARYVADRYPAPVAAVVRAGLALRLAAKTRARG
jgi:N-acetylglucosaminyl-diphospho-decaprenol L-rhamnosyltransferase